MGVIVFNSKRFWNLIPASHRLPSIRSKAILYA